MEEEINQEVKEEVEIKKYIEFDDFEKVELKVGEILECKKVENADKLLVSQVKIGDEVRQIVSGIALYYTPEQMVGKKVIVVANLKPRKLRGLESAGMLLCAVNGDDLSLVSLDKLELPSGSEVC